MNLSLKSGSIAKLQTPLAIIGIFSGEALPQVVAGLIEADDFSGTFKKTMLVTNGGKQAAARRLLLLGLGSRDELTTERLRRAYAYASIKATELNVRAAAIALPEINDLDRDAALRAIADGVLLADYRFDRFKGAGSKKNAEPQTEIEEITIVGEGNAAVLELAQTVAKGVKLARDLGNEPPAVCTPTRFADVAREIADRGGMQLTVLDRDQMRELGMGGMIGVSQAAHEEPKFIVLEYGKKGSGKTLALVGKGITFDSGGISIKPAEKMDLMKMDMMGAAAVLGTMSALADLKPDNVHVVGIVAATENLPGGHAYKPGDILTAMNGVTMEILNTDAEGRLVLADGLSYAQRYEPDAIIDLATLTGAVVIALGIYITAMITNNSTLAERVKRVGEQTGELVWELPLLPEYRQAVKSKIADVRNTSSLGRAAGTITAGAFLENFVDGRPWVHLDIAGTAWVEEPPKSEDQPQPYNRRGATGIGVRLLVDLVQSYAAEQ
ncbi:MAG TPA: leucyl aminopeptidase [Herpetosiphonaceae bacterium]